MKLTGEQLNRLRHMDIMELDRVQLTDAKDIVIDMEKSVESRIEDYLEQMGNPYALKSGDYILQTGFLEDTKDTADDRMLLFLKREQERLL